MRAPAAAAPAVKRLLAVASAAGAELVDVRAAERRSLPGEMSTPSVCETRFTGAGTSRVRVKPRPHLWCRRHEETGRETRQAGDSESLRRAEMSGNELKRGAGSRIQQHWVVRHDHARRVCSAGNGRRFDLQAILYGPDRDRTCDLGIKSPLLYQLSYRPAAVYSVAAMSKGYAEGSALEERLADLERSKRQARRKDVPLRLAVFGSTVDEAEAHFLGWADEVDADDLFASGGAYGINLRRVPVPTRRAAPPRDGAAPR